ncbi:amidohydrolase family protein [Pontivivens ytuae]|uniref:Amidohydrolase n=1 Tax=Pontivivens ytuae TaxID=2789856 RepID=A0A7S9LUH9_9RHOB|nr:amidohydrolase family protein [Pontivivens ytuae]QPH55240.1 amidohydrolase [Pontivivens ytuae]
MSRRITNCHIHLFTLEHTPDRYPVSWLPKGVRNWLARTRTGHRITKSSLRGVGRLIGDDSLVRLSRFIATGGLETQKDMLRHVQRYYPSGTRFVVLPMDMSQMGAGDVCKDLGAQHDELAALARDPEGGGAVIPFAAVDPRNPEHFSELRRCVEEYGFRGVKLYPPLGFDPSDRRLMEKVYPYCIEHDLPVLSHCSRGGVRGARLDKWSANLLARPQAFKPVLESFPDLRVCLAHFGGGAAWEEYVKVGLDPADPEARKENFLASLLDMLRAEDAPGVRTYPGLYTDISYTSFNYEDYIPVLSVFLQDRRIRDRVLFGSDFYMTEQEELPERSLSMRLRFALGEEAFWQIAHENPKRWLGEMPAEDAPEAAVRVPEPQGA